MAEIKDMAEIRDMAEIKDMAEIRDMTEMKDIVEIRDMAEIRDRADVKNIWVDTDPGIDDAVAIAAACSLSDRLHICGISTVAGNQTIDKVTANALWLTQKLGRPDIAVVRGADRPLIRSLAPAGNIHGEFGLGYVIPEGCDRVPYSDQGAAAIYRIIQALPEGETLSMVTIGPLTNIALLLRAFPDVMKRIDQIVCMGGSTVEGNITATAEFNIWADPEAAEIVFQSGIPIVMCGLDVTMQCLLYPEDVMHLMNGTAMQKTIGGMLQFYLDSTAYREKGYVAMHDSVPVLYLVYPELFAGRQHVIHVSCTEDTCRGMTMICDGDYTYTAKSERKNVFVLKQANSEEFRKKLMKILT